jgi:outer membrane beta-barrel protein
MTKPGSLFAIAAAATILVVDLAWVAGPTLVVNEAEAQRRRRRPRPTPPPAEPTPAPAPEPPPEPVIEIEPEGTPPPIDIDTPPPADPGPAEAETPAAQDKDLAAAQRGVSWQDVVVVMRKPFLKQGRFELQPSWNVTLNDNMIRHHAASAQLIYWLTDALAIGVEGNYYTRFGFLGPHELVATAYRRLPTLNEYKWGAALNFHYAPIYAKFAVFNKFLVHWEGRFTAGVGVMQSEVLPRNPEHPGWTNTLIAPNIGFEARVFVTDWITLNLGVKDYIFVDKFESVDREMANVEDAKANATTQLINNIMFTAGFSFWIPTGFQYTTFR